MKVTRVISTIATLMAVNGCQSNPVKVTETVLERSGHADKRPDWLTESEPVKMNDDQMTSIGLATIPADFSLDRGLEAAESSAKKGIIRELETRLQKATEANQDQADVISNKAVHSLSEKIQRTSQYWERISGHAVGTSNSKDVQFYRVYALVSLSKADLKAAMTVAVAAAVKENGVGSLPQKSADRVLSESPNLLAKQVIIKAKIVTPEPAPIQEVVAPIVMRETASAVGSFTVQVFALSRETRAKRVTNVLKAKGLDAFYSTAEVGDHQFFRVKVGHYPSRSSAVAATDDVKKRGDLDAAFVQKTE